jgi:hypothetical protein
MHAKQFDGELFRNNRGEKKIEKVSIYIYYLMSRSNSGAEALRFASQLALALGISLLTAQLIRSFKNPISKLWEGKSISKKVAKVFGVSARKKKKKMCIVAFTLSEFDSFGGFIIWYLSFFSSWWYFFEWCISDDAVGMFHWHSVCFCVFFGLFFFQQYNAGSMFFLPSMPLAFLSLSHLVRWLHHSACVAIKFNMCINM